ncbi:receptor-transporting protein 3-like [Apus apus]|uniref:receptor-transporting protein 3-like n=1 Tax=Apus apus TaxID=8895 RepID=UPI0021F87A95|nr:receptor-transporting protein 3-like [Apus apus]
MTLVTASSPAPGGTMGIWQDIFAAKIADRHLKESWVLQEDDTLQIHAPRSGWKEFVQYRALARFQCSQCFHEWSSARVHVVFHMCRSRSRGRGKVKMRVFRQACRRCPDPQLEEPEFSQETMERLLHNLVLNILKDFYHMPIQPSDLMEVVVDAVVAGPHDSTRCEGCQLGFCSQSRPALLSGSLDPLVVTGKARTHRSPKCQGTRHCATLTHHSFNSFPWQRCCFFVVSLLCVLAVLLFIIFYFTRQ